MKNLAFSGVALVYRNVPGFGRGLGQHLAGGRPGFPKVCPFAPDAVATPDAHITKLLVGHRLPDLHLVERHLQFFSHNQGHRLKRTLPNFGLMCHQNNLSGIFQNDQRADFQRHQRLRRPGQV